MADEICWCFLSLEFRAQLVADSNKWGQNDSLPYLVDHCGTCQSWRWNRQISKSGIFTKIGLRIRRHIVSFQAKLSMVVWYAAQSALTELYLFVWASSCDLGGCWGGEWRNRRISIIESCSNAIKIHCGMKSSTKPMSGSPPECCRIPPTVYTTSSSTIHIVVIITKPINIPRHLAYLCCQAFALARAHYQCHFDLVFAQTRAKSDAFHHRLVLHSSHQILTGNFSSLVYSKSHPAVWHLQSLQLHFRVVEVAQMHLHWEKISVEVQIVWNQVMFGMCSCHCVQLAIFLIYPVVCQICFHIRCLSHTKDRLYESKDSLDIEKGSFSFKTLLGFGDAVVVAFDQNDFFSVGDGWQQISKIHTERSNTAYRHIFTIVSNSWAQCVSLSCNALQWSHTAQLELVWFFSTFFASQSKRRFVWTILHWSQVLVVRGLSDTARWFLRGEGYSEWCHDLDLIARKLFRPMSRRMNKYECSSSYRLSRVFKEQLFSVSNAYVQCNENLT